MKNRYYTICGIVALFCLIAQSCDKSDPVSSFPAGQSASAVQMGVNAVTYGFLGTKSSDGTLANVYGDPEEGLTISEYVSDIIDAPQTKGFIADITVSRQQALDMVRSASLPTVLSTSPSLWRPGKMTTPTTMMMSMTTAR